MTDDEPRPSGCAPDVAAAPAAAQRRYGPAVFIVVTLIACSAAVLYRTQIRSRYWAGKIASAADASEVATYLAALCNAGDEARWGVSTLIGDSNAENRRWGVLALHRNPSSWSNARLADLLDDPDENVRQLAALGLALHGDHAVIPRLKEMYGASGAQAASGACAALARLGDAAAVAALAELAAIDAPPAHRAYLIDALREIASPGCIPPLTRLLEDHRPCPVAAYEDREAARALAKLAAAGYACDVPPPHDPATDSRPAPTTPADTDRLEPPDRTAAAASRSDRPQTVAQRAADALRRLNGTPPAAATQPAERP